MTFTTSIDAMNYFELYGIPVSLQPNQQLVKSQYYKLSRQYHPDFFSNGSQAEQEEALERSSQVNNAYKMLQNPHETIRYVLMEKGLMQKDEKYQLPPDFLMEVLELNEQLTEAKFENDETAFEAIKYRISELSNEIYEPVESIVAHYQEGITAHEELLQVKDYYYKKKYLDRILEGLK